ncbi:hypothetical protein LTR53_018938, partial [Teratosphaeriaceae sp. CCFEE 6253]
MESGKHGNVKEIAATGYDRHAKTYDTWTQSRPEGLEIRLGMLDKLLSNISVTNEGHPAELKILELGCGSGDPVTLHLATNPTIGSVVANDISSTMLAMLDSNLAKVAQNAADKVTIAGGDMTALEIGFGTLDAVVAFYSIIHLEQDDQKKM